MKTESIKILVIEEDPIWVQFIESIFDNAAFELLGFVKPVEQARDIIEKENSFILICDINNINESSIFRLFENEKYANIPTIFMTNILDANTHKIVTLAKKSKAISQIYLIVIIRLDAKKVSN